MLTTPIYGFKKPELADSPPNITVTNPNWDKTELELKKNADAAVANSSAIGQLTVQKDESKTTTFNPDGSITETTTKSGVTVRSKTTSFPSSATIIETIIEDGITTTKTITFNPDRSITEGVV